jgi:DNA-binding transcriptional regulator YiaG
VSSDVENITVKSISIKATILTAKLHSYARLRATGKLTVNEVANLLGVTVATVRRWGKRTSSKPTPTMIEMDTFTSIPASIHR